MLRILLTTFFATALALPTVALASTTAAYAALDRASAAACIKASGLQGAKVGATVRFSDRVLIDARVVSGTYPQPHMKGARATMLCAYNRRTKRAETQEMPPPEQLGLEVAIKDVWWSATSIAGAGVIAGGPITMMLGSDGKIVGKSGCNNYALNYSLSGAMLKTFGVPIGTRMMCAAPVMAQEVRFTQILQAVTNMRIDTDGALLATTQNGDTLRFHRSNAQGGN